MKRIIKPSILILIFLVAVHTWGNIAVLCFDSEMEGWKIGLTLLVSLAMWALLLFGVFRIKSILNDAKTIPAIGLAELCLITAWIFMTSDVVKVIGILSLFPVFLLACILVCSALKPLFERRSAALILSLIFAVGSTVSFVFLGPRNFFSSDFEQIAPFFNFLFWTPIILSAVFVYYGSRAFYFSYLVCVVIFLVFGMLFGIMPSVFIWVLLFAIIGLLFWAPPLTRDADAATKQLTVSK